MPHEDAVTSQISTGIATCSELYLDFTSFNNEIQTISLYFLITFDDMGKSNQRFVILLTYLLLREEEIFLNVIKPTNYMYLP